MTITKVNGRPVTRLGDNPVYDLDADLYVMLEEMVDWPRARVEPMRDGKFKARLQVLDGGGRDAGSAMLDSAAQDALLDLNDALTVCPFLTPRGRIAVAGVRGVDMIEALKWSIDRPERSICLVCRET